MTRVSRSIQLVILPVLGSFNRRLEREPAFRHLINGDAVKHGFTADGSLGWTISMK